MAGAYPIPQPPRPSEWEVPDLKDESRFFIPQPVRLRHISDRLFTSLASFIQSPPHDKLWWARRPVERFLRREVLFGNRPDWEPHRLLGQGGFGTAGLWVRSNADGHIVDELAVKEQRSSYQPGESEATMALRYTEPGGVWYRGLLKEAVIQKQMNEAKCENLLHLRGYAFVTNKVPIVRENDRDRRRMAAASNFPFVRKRKRAKDDADDAPARTELAVDDPGRHRFYLEYAPHQNLEELINLYRAGDTHLPEAFLWHVFDSLAAALQVLAKGPDQKFSSSGWTRNSVKYWPDDYEVVHLDIKTNNIFLGYKDWKDDRTDVTGGSAMLGYPVVKLADFGLADITGRSDPDNVRNNHWKLTPGFKPPENTFYGWGWQHPPNTNALQLHGPGPHDSEALFQGVLAAPNFFYGSANNVWGIGKVMYDLMTLSHTRDFDSLCDRWAQEHHYQANNSHFIPPNAWNTETFRRAMQGDSHPVQPQHVPPTPYSSDLHDLIKACLKPAIRQRISLDELRRKTQLFLAQTEHHHWPGPRSQRPRKKPRRRARRGPILPQVNTAPSLSYRDRNLVNVPTGVFSMRRNFGVRNQDYYDFANRRFLDGSWPDVRPPPKFAALPEYGLYGWPVALWPQNYDVHGGRIWFGGPPTGTGAAQPQPAGAGGPQPPPAGGAAGGATAANGGGGDRDGGSAAAAAGGGGGG